MSTQNLLLLLAASNASDGEIEDLFEWVELHSARRAARIIRDLRQRASLLERTAGSRNTISAIAADLRSSADQNEGEHASMIDAVEKLLLKECGFSKAQAIRALSDGLKDAPTKYGYLAAPNKMSFRRWLAKIGDDVSDSRVLHVASKIRNEVTHGRRPVSDWPI